jgi:energy-coupling factor transporter ATP-binding protein EcfA2
MESFRDINEKDRKTVILVTHDAKYLPYAHRVFYMRDGALRRVVVNPEKEQVKRVKPGETIVTEIEQLARLYPYAEPIELKVKSVVNFATQTMTFSQLQRLEGAVLSVLKGSMDESMLYDLLIKDIPSGGVGLKGDESMQITKKIFSLMRYSRDVSRFRNMLHEENVFMQQHHLIDNLLEYLSLESGLHSSEEQLGILRAAVSDRVGGIINAEDFQQKLVLSGEMGGAHYKPSEAVLITRHLEKLIAQGGYVIRPNELLGGHT